jgi:hypothetical protein
VRRAALLAAVATALAFAAAPSARADGDPASDYLITQKVFFPYDLKVPAEKQKQIVALVDEANAAGLKLRVALVWSSYDLGSVTSLWRKPKLYARFLGQELKFIYKDRLLVVMPNGFGVNDPKAGTSPDYDAVAGIRVAPGGAGFVDASIAAVQALARAHGVTLEGATVAASPSRSHDRIVILIAALAALAVAVVLRLALRRRGD